MVPAVVLPKRSMLMTTLSGFMSQSIRGGGDDPAVGLVGNEGIDVTALQSVAGQDLLAEFGLFADGELENRLPVLMDVVHPLVHRFLGGGMEASAAGHVERTTAGTIHFMNEIDHALGVVLGRLQDHRARAVAKYHAGGAIGVVDDRRHYVRSNHHDFFVGSGRDELRPGLQRINECGAGGGKIESPDSLCAQLVLHQAGGGGEKHVRRDRGHNDASSSEGSRPRWASARLQLRSRVAGGDAFFHDVALANAGALHNPVVRVSTIFSRSSLVSRRGGT